MLWTVLAGLLLAGLLGVAVWQDILTRRIPNWLVLCGLIAGLACNAFVSQGSGLFMAEGGGLGLWQSLFGMLAGGALLLPLYLLRAMGAGDVKLMAALGAFFGPWQIVGVVLLTFLAGGVLALGAACISRKLRAVFDNLRLMLLFVVAGRAAGLSLSDVGTTGRLPYAIAIVFGVGLQLWLAGNPGWPFA